MATTFLGMATWGAIAQERSRPESGDRGGERFRGHSTPEQDRALERRPQFGRQGGRGSFMRILPIMIALDADSNGII